MAYQQNKPQANDVKSQSQADIQGNFQAIKTLIDVNHGTFGSANEGKHNKVSLPVQSPAPTFAAGEEGLYTFLNPTTAKNELYVHRQTVDAPTDIPFTASKVSNTAMASSDSGWTYLPSGILLKWGRVSAPTATVAITPTVTSGGPNFTRVFRAMVTPQDSGTATNFNCGQRTAAAAPSGNFNAYCSNPSATTSVIYLVIGV